MTISPVSLADIEQTMTELQQSPGVATGRFGVRVHGCRRERVRGRLCHQPGSGDRAGDDR